MRPSLVLLAVLAPAYAAFPTSVLYNSPTGLFLENIAVRPNGKLLITSDASPTLFSLDPHAKDTSLTAVHTFSGPNGTALTGIAEYAPDAYAVVVSTLDLTTRTAQLGSVAIWRADFSRSPPTFAPAANIPTSPLTNGLSAVPGLPGVVLAADSALGAVYVIDIRAGTVRTLAQDPALGPAPANNLGVNGLHVHGGSLYATNTAQGTFLRAPLAVRPPVSVALTGPWEVIGTFAGTPGALAGFDDFAIDRRGRAWVTVHPGSLSVFTPLRNGTWLQETAAGDAQGDDGVFPFPGPTSAAFARGGGNEGLLYVTNGAGQVVVVDTSKEI